MIRFKIIDTLILTNIGAVVLAECLDSEFDFKLSDSSLLGEVPLKPVINNHRRIDEQGNYVLNVFTFQLKTNTDKDKFQKDEIVLLIP
jgi:hypothetical protein